MNKKFAIRLVQAEYLYTRFGNACQFAVCSNNNESEQLSAEKWNRSRLGRGERAAVLPSLHLPK